VPDLPVGIEDVRAAAERIRGRVHRTPLLRSRSIDAIAGREFLFKAENLQRGGAFKARGATNHVALACAGKERPRGVATYSSGNHAQGVAIAAGAFGLPCVVVMPEDAPRAKVEATRGYGAEVLFRGRTSEERRALAEEVVRERGYRMVPPFDDPDVVAGQGTVGLEIVEDAPEVGAFVVPVGGGGLIAGIAVAAKALKAGVRVFGVEPEAADGLRRSLEAGKIVTIRPGETIADGLRPVAPGKIPFAIASRLVEGVVTVTDGEIARAVALLAERTKLLVEPSGAASLAAVLAGKVPPVEGPTAVVLSGGNADPALFARLLAGGS
jgi:threonine dehydratase